MTFTSLLYLLGKIAGVFGFFTLGLLIFSGDSARFWDRFIGLDRIIKFQRKFAFVTAFFVIGHPIFFALSTGRWFNFFVPQFTLWPLAAGIMAFYLFLVVMAASVFYKRVSYQAWQYLHIGTYLLFFFAAYHLLNWGSDKNILLWPTMVMSVLVIVGLIYRTNYKWQQRTSKFFTVTNVKPETEQIFTLSLKPQQKFSFAAGQFCFLRLEKNKLYARHPFTIASAPSVSEVSFTIKLAGRFTQTARNLKPGETVIVDGPFGRFSPKDTTAPVVFIAGGIGITPFMSMLREQQSTDRQQNVTLFYAAKTKAEAAFYRELNELNVPWLKKIFIFSQETTPTDSQNFSGHLSADFIKQYVPDFLTSQFYICGPEGMKSDLEKQLKKTGLAISQIFSESFFW